MDPTGISYFTMIKMAYAAATGVYNLYTLSDKQIKKAESKEAAKFLAKQMAGFPIGVAAKPLTTWLINEHNIRQETVERYKNINITYCTPMLNNARNCYVDVIYSKKDHDESRGSIVTRAAGIIKYRSINNRSSILGEDGIWRFCQPDEYIVIHDRDENSKWTGCVSAGPFGNIYFGNYNYII